MNQHTPLDDIKEESAQAGKDMKTRRLLILLLGLWLITLAILVGVAWGAYFQEKGKALTLAEQIASACRQGDLGEGLTPDDLEPGLSPEDEEALCDNATKVIEENDPELQDQEIQEAEIQDPEIQEPEFLDPEIQDAERQDSERQDAEEQELEIQDPEIQDDEIQDPEEQNPEEQDPEINDPDPADDDVTGGECTFDGVGTITFTLQTDSGPVTFTCTGTGTPPGQQ